MADKLTALTQALPDPLPLQGGGHYEGPLSWVISGVGGLILASIWFRRRMSRDGAEIAKDRAETNIVEVLRQERDKAMGDAREAWARRTADAEQIAALRSENEFLKRDINRLSEELEELKESVAILRHALSRISGTPPAPPVLSIPSA